MRSVARRSARLASSSTVRVALPSPPSAFSSASASLSVSASGRRPLASSEQLPSPLNRRVRCLSSSPALRAGSGGNDPPSRDELDRWIKNQKIRDDEAFGGSGEEAEAEASESGTLAGDGSARTAKTFRQRKKALVNPSPRRPPEIPSWFLKYNVKLHVETSEPDRNAAHAQALRVVDGDSGHTLFTLPYYEAWPVPGMNAKSPFKGQQAADCQVPKSSSDQDFSDKQVDGQTRDGTSSLKPNRGPTTTSRASDAYQDINPHALIRWSVLQAETAIRAAYALARQGPRASSQPTSGLDLSLVCKDTESHEQLDDFVEDLAAITGADIVRLDANDLVELASEYVDRGSDASVAFSNLAYDVFGGYTSTPVQKPEPKQEQSLAEETIDEDDEEDEDDPAAAAASNAPPLLTLSNLRTALTERHQDFTRAMSKIGPRDIIIDMGPRSSRSSSRSYKSGDSPRYDEARLCALLESLLEAPSKKRSLNASGSAETFQHRFNLHKSSSTLKKGLSDHDISNQTLWRMWRSSPGCWLPDAAGLLAAHVQRFSNDASLTALNLRVEVAGEIPPPAQELHKQDICTIVHVRDLKDICNSRLGESAIRRLVQVVQKLRRGGRQFILVGSSCCDDVLNAVYLESFRHISVPAVFHMSKHDQTLFKPRPVASDHLALPPCGRILEINLRHLSGMLRCLRPDEQIDLFSEPTQLQLRLSGDALGQKVLSHDMIQRIVLTAIGLSEVHAVSERITPGHLGLAAWIMQRAAQTDRDWSDFIRRKDHGVFGNGAKHTHKSSTVSDRGPSKIDLIKKDCNQHESRLLASVVNPDNIKIGFDQVHAPAETIESLRTLTSMVLLRPEAFQYGILAADRLPGLMLYGPPGTGKTLLAKAVAKESGATVLEISGAQIYEKYVGEGEKMVRAVFSLAKKLTPCLVFIDEADAIFGSRSNAGNRNTHREIINQFLREWDGMDASDCFMMVASNRPFDLDDAVLRRLPRRLLVDLPVAKDRESILNIHLRGETLDSTVNLAQLAESTPLYSGSDLKNLCVAAALACVREENDLKASKKDEKDFKLPEKRTLSQRHFEKALKEISASISEDMSSLSAIRKFDEQFGDRRGRRRKSAYGFGIGETSVDESTARVRQPPPP